MIAHALSSINSALSSAVDSITSIAPALANHLWQSTAFALAAWLVTLLLRSNAARVRYAIWLTASLKFLLPFSLLVSLGALLPHPQQVIVAAPIDTAVDTVAMPFSDTAIDIAPITPHPTRTQILLRALPELLAALWLIGALITLTIWLARWRSISATRRRALPAHTGRELEILHRLQTPSTAEINEPSFWRSQNLRIGLWTRRPATSPTPIPLLLSPELMEPGIVGILRPALLWPLRLSARLDDLHIEAILAHELMHVRRRDNLAAALHMLVETLFWFHPLVWFIERRMVEERERACDQAVVQLGSAPGIYADSLLKACRFCVESPLACVSGITGADLNRRVRSIMTLRLARLTLPRKLLLATLALAAIAVPIAFGILHSPLTIQAAAQSPTDDKLPTFDVVSIKPSRQGELRVQDMPVDLPDGISTQADTVLDLIRAAYGPRKFPVNDRIVAAPDWAAQEGFDIQAKVAGADVPMFQKLSFDQRRPMLQALLADRFKLKIHTETRQLPVYELVVGKGNPKLKEAKPDDIRPNGLKNIYGKPINVGIIKFVGRTEAVAQATTMSSLADLLSQPFLGIGRPVVDKTGLTGMYDFTLKWTPDQIANGAPPTDDSAPSIFTAIPEQLGLKLVPSKGPVEVLVIDHIEKPSLDNAQTSVPASPSPIPALHPSLTPVASTQANPAPTAQSSPTPTVTASIAPSFDVATIKPSDERPGVTHQVGAQVYPGGRIVINYISLKGLISIAFHIGYWQISGGESWTDKANFDIEAKPSEEWQTKITNITHSNFDIEDENIRRMLQALLIDRFRLKVHLEAKTGKVYLLEQSGNLTTLPPTKVTATAHPGAPEGFSGNLGRNGMYNTSMPQLAKFAADYVFHQPVIDRTSLVGSFDFRRKVDSPYPTQPEGAPVDQEEFEDNFRQLIKDMGLNLVPSTGPVETIVIDHADRPSEN